VGQSRVPSGTRADRHPPPAPASSYRTPAPGPVGTAELHR
jgi:hypothetical protein